MVMVYMHIILMYYLLGHIPNSTLTRAVSISHQSKSEDWDSPETKHSTLLHQFYNILRFGNFHLPEYFVDFIEFLGFQCCL